MQTYVLNKASQHANRIIIEEYSLAATMNCIDRSIAKIKIVRREFLNHFLLSYLLIMYAMINKSQQVSINDDNLHV